MVCERLCDRRKNCGRHRCTEVCCAARRLKEDSPAYQAAHMCMLICNKELRCGAHRCDMLCHSGHCPPCLNASFDELHCRCGKTVMLPPIPCGTPRPPCPHPCTRAHDCMHPVKHTCHDGELCPPCTELGERVCMGGHEVRNAVPCHVKDISCGKQCGKTLPCGTHACPAVCHKGSCEGVYKKDKGLQQAPAQSNDDVEDWEVSFVKEVYSILFHVNVSEKQCIMSGCLADNLCF